MAARTGTGTHTTAHARAVLPKRARWNAGLERERWYRVPGHGWKRRSLAETEQRYARKFAEPTFAEPTAVTPEAHPWTR